MSERQYRGHFRLAAITCAVLSMHNAVAATRTDLSKGVQRDAMASVDVRPTNSAFMTADGKRKVRYQQFYQGVPVWGENPIVAEQAVGRNGVLSDAAPTFVSGTLVEGINADLPMAKPRLGLDDARRLLRAQVVSHGANLANAEHDDINLQVQLDKNGRAQFVYVASIFLHGPTPSRPSFVIDANTGAILQSWDDLQHREATGIGGNEKVGAYHYGKEYKTLSIMDDCSYDSANVMTIDMKNGTAAVTTPFKIASCPTTGVPNNDARAINGAFSPENDGQGFGNVLFNMYKDWYGVRPIEQKLSVRVHYGDNYSNAFWDGRAMTFGDGGSGMYPLVSLGVLAHEVSHGYTGQHSKLIYSGMSGGMNEAFSDMAAQAAEEYFLGKPTFLIGGEIVKAQGKALRYMLNPEQDGKSIGDASKFTSSLNVHYSSGVYNKAFALLATTPGWSARKAFEVMLIANTLYWKSGSTFNEGACGVVQAAKDKGYPDAEVTAAFAKVGVSCDGTVPGGGGTTGTVLSNGVALTGQTIAAGKSLAYTVNVPANAGFLVVRLGNGSGDANVYLKAGTTAPTTTSFDASSTQSGNAEYALVKAPKAGVYSILVTAGSAVSGLSVIAVSR
jgi:Zn-dependent metalloprotease